MRDVLDEDEGGFKPLSALLLTLAAVLACAIGYNAMFRQHPEQAQRIAVNLPVAGGGTAHTEVSVDAANTVVIKYDPLVEDVQRELLTTGIYRGLVDGVNGQRTKVAVEQYQRANNLPVTGEASKDLVDHIRYTNKVKAASEFTGAIDLAPQPPPVSPVRAPKLVLQVTNEQAKQSLGIDTIKRAASLAPAISSKQIKIKKIQIALASLGYKPGAVTGSVNATTKSAILKFQMDNGLSMDGTIDGKLLSALQIPKN